MKISELQNLEKEMIDGLRTRAGQGDNEAAKVLLEHLRHVSEAISQWRKAQDSASEQKQKPKT